MNIEELTLEELREKRKGVIRQMQNLTNILKAIEAELIKRK